MWAFVMAFMAVEKIYPFCGPRPPWGCCDKNGLKTPQPIWLPSRHSSNKDVQCNKKWTVFLGILKIEREREAENGAIYRMSHITRIFSALEQQHLKAAYYNDDIFLKLWEGSHLVCRWRCLPCRLREFDVKLFRRKRFLLRNNNSATLKVFI
jgi:hypothetical protein